MTPVAAVRRELPVYAPARIVARRRRVPVRIVPDVVLRGARRADVVPIHELLSGYARMGRLLPRTIEQVSAEREQYVVAIENGRIVGCAALRVYDARLAEVCALAVAASYQGRGLGRLLVEHLVERAARRGVARVLALTLEDAFFERLGFERASMTEFPQKYARDCASCARRSTCPEVAVVYETTSRHASRRN